MVSACCHFGSSHFGSSHFGSSHFGSRLLLSKTCVKRDRGVWEPMQRFADLLAKALKVEGSVAPTVTFLGSAPWVDDKVSEPVIGNVVPAPENDYAAASSPMPVETYTSHVPAPVDSVVTVPVAFENPVDTPWVDDKVSDPVIEFVVPAPEIDSAAASSPKPVETYTSHVRAPVDSVVTVPVAFENPVDEGVRAAQAPVDSAASVPVVSEDSLDEGVLSISVATVPVRIRRCPFSDVREKVPESFAEFVSSVGGGRSSSPLPASFDEYILEASIRLQRTRPQIYHVADSLKLLRPPWCTPHQPPPEGFEWVRLMPWEEYEEEKRKEDEEREKEKKLSWEKYLRRLCDRKQKEEAEEEKEFGKEKEKDKEQEKGVVINMKSEVLSSRFNALFAEGREVEKEKKKEKEEEELCFDRPRRRCQRALASERDPAKVEELLQELSDIERCRKATRAMYIRSRRMRWGPALTEEEMAMSFARAKKLTADLQQLMFQKGDLKVVGSKARPETNSIKILHRTPAGLGVFWVGLGVSLNGWYGDTFGGLGVNLGGGYWTTKGGRVLNGDAPGEGGGGGGGWGLTSTQKLCFSLG